MATMSTVQIQSDGRLKIVAHASGDGGVLRRSALMDEREEKRLGNRLASPIGWSRCCLFFPIIWGWRWIRPSSTIFCTFYWKGHGWDRE